MLHRSTGSVSSRRKSTGTSGNTDETGLGVKELQIVTVNPEGNPDDEEVQVGNDPSARKVTDGKRLLDDDSVAAGHR
jgi:hypothetical protein